MISSAATTLQAAFSARSLQLGTLVGGQARVSGMADIALPLLLAVVRQPLEPCGRHHLRG